MPYTKKIAAAAICIIAIALVFSGCTPKQNDTNISNSFGYNQSGTIPVNSDSLEQTDTSTSESNSYRLSDQQTTQAKSKNPQGETMKQLSDFKQIEASTVTLVTDKGEIIIELYRDKAPITTANFLELADSGFYNGIRFHRIIEDFMAQVGDPLSKDLDKQAAWGTGGPGYVIPDEFDPTLTHSGAGIVSMANRGPNTGGSQFFITYEPTPWLDGKHTVFGKVTAGMEVVENLEIGDAITSVRIE